MSGMLLLLQNRAGRLVFPSLQRATHGVCALLLPIGSVYDNMNSWFCPLLPDQTSFLKSAFITIEMDNTKILSSSALNPAPLQSWHPRLRNTPWLAMSAILLAIVCTIASAIVIVVSNNQPVSSWRVQPAVLLAIISSTSNLTLAFALSSANTITWWRNALHGTTISQLYYIWNPIRHWRSLKSAISSSVDYRKIFFTTIIVSIANLATAPLFQRASYVRNGLIAKNITFEASMAEWLPTSYIGEVDYAAPGNMISADAWKSVSSQWNANTTIIVPSYPDSYCNGRCEGNIRATGLITNCSSITRFVDLSKPLNNGTAVFNTNVTRGEDYNHIPTLTLIATYSVAADNNTCMATIVDETCDVKVASVQYPVIVENQTITFDSDKYPNIGELEAYAGDSPNASLGDPTGPLAGLGWSFSDSWSTLSGLFQFLDPNTNITSYFLLTANPPVSIQYIITSKEENNTAFTCAITFNRPTDDIIKSFRQLMFRAGLYLAAANDTHNISMVQTTPVLVYQSDYSWFGVAITVMAIATFSCLIPHWGWWELGREVSLNPIETAKAFNVPGFQTAGLGCSAKDIVKDVGHLQVGYVQVQLQDATGNPVPTMELRPLET